MLNLTKGINLGGFLSQCVYKTEHYNTFILRDDIKTIAEMNFDHVRLPIDYEVIETESGEEIPENYVYIDNTIKWCKEFGLNLVLDVHKTWGYTFTKAAETGANTLFDSEEAKERFLNLWDKLSKRYGKEENVALELLNEVVNPEYAQPWNDLIDRAVALIRKNAPLVTIIYGGVEWNSAGTLKYLREPADENILFTFHYYEPLVFTHQKAYWVPTIKQDLTVNYSEGMDYLRKESVSIGLQGMPCANSKAATMAEYHEEMLSAALAEAERRGMKLYCGEFGVIDKAPAREAILWYKDVLQLFRRYGFGYAIWSYKEMDFGLMGDDYKEVRDYIREIQS